MRKSLDCLLSLLTYFVNALENGIRIWARLLQLQYHDTRWNTIYICQSVCLSVSLSVCMSRCESVYPSLHISLKQENNCTTWPILQQSHHCNILDFLFSIEIRERLDRCTQSKITHGKSLCVTKWAIAHIYILISDHVIYINWHNISIIVVCCVLWREIS